VKVISRPASSSPSVGQHSRHVEELKGILSDAFAEVKGRAEENY
jgi:2-oxoglutarate dehydrogenase E1 component